MTGSDDLVGRDCLARSLLGDDSTATPLHCRYQSYSTHTLIREVVNRGCIHIWLFITSYYIILPNSGLHSPWQMQRSSSMPLSPPGWISAMHSSTGSLARASRSSSTYKTALPGSWWGCTNIHITPILKSLHWLPVTFRIKYNVSLLTHQCIHGHDPPTSRSSSTPRPPHAPFALHQHTPSDWLRPSSALWAIWLSPLLPQDYGTPSLTTWRPHRLQLFLNETLRLIFLKKRFANFSFAVHALYVLTTLYIIFCLWNSAAHWYFQM